MKKMTLYTSTLIILITVISSCGQKKKQGDLTGSDVESKFKGTIYHAKVTKGGITLNPSTGIPVFNGVITGTQVVTNKPYQQWQSIESVETNCRILDYDPPDFLVDGKVVKYESKTIFLAPGATITNDTRDKRIVPLASLTGGPVHELKYGETVRVQPDGTFKTISTN